MVLDLTTLLVMPKMFSFVEVSLPRQIAGKNCFTKFTNWCLMFLVPASVVAGVAICMHCIPVQQVGSIHGMMGCLLVSRVL